MSLCTFTHDFSIDGNNAVASVSPCSWIYARMGLRVAVSVANSTVYFDNKSLKFADATEADVVALASQAKLCPCVKCGGATLVDPQSNRNGQCETCFLSAVEKRFEKERASVAKVVKAIDAAMGVSGSKFKTVAWVHPLSGDDYQIAHYSVQTPTKNDMAKVLKRYGSTRTDDYVTGAL